MLDLVDTVMGYWIPFLLIYLAFMAGLYCVSCIKGIHSDIITFVLKILADITDGEDAEYTRPIRKQIKKLDSKILLTPTSGTTSLIL